MCDFDRQFPGYGLALHKGYGTIFPCTGRQLSGLVGRWCTGLVLILRKMRADLCQTQEKIIRQYGRWDSPISASSMASGISLSGLDCDMGQALVWLEGRSDARGVGGGQARWTSAFRFDQPVLGKRRWFGYGGGEFTARKGQVYFAEANSGRLYRQSLLSGSAHAVTPAFGKAASPVYQPMDVG